jgi:tetratricopeptide (TPR) repeat protein
MAMDESGPAPAPAPTMPMAPMDRPNDAFMYDREGEVLQAMPPRQRWIPMRKIWERVGYVTAPATTPKAANGEEIAKAESAALDDTNREAVKKLYSLYMLAGDVDRAAQVAERWSEKDPLDADALTARADIAAARGQRDLAIRILGSVVDVRPGDHKAQWRLARLHRWAGRATMGCRHSLAVSQIRPTDGKLLAEAVRCARDVGQSGFADDLLRAVDETTRSVAEKSLSEPGADPNELKGDFRIEATWDGGQDLDLALLHPEGHRVSWLGAPTRSVITARDVLSTSREALALRGAEPGEYIVEIGRGQGSNAIVRGTVEVTAGKTKRQIPFVLDGTRARLALVNIAMKPRLVPL